MGGEKLQKFINRWNRRFEIFVVPSNGKFGGLICLWDRSITLSILKGDQNLILCEVTDPDFCKSFVMCCAYGSPKRVDKIDSLKHLLSHIDSYPWLLVGDLNLVFDREEKDGGVWHSSLQYKIKQLWDQSGFIDLGFVGEKYTWTNLQQGKATILARLDRACANPEWTTLFPSVKVFHLDPFLSDHLPILVDTNYSRARKLS